MAINKSTIQTNVWEAIYDRINSEVTSVTLSDFSTVTRQSLNRSFPDVSNESKSDYPIIVLPAVTISWSDFTFKKKSVEGRFEIEVYATKAEAADRFLDKVIDSIETYRPTLYGLGLTNINLEDTNEDQAFRGSFKVHLRTATFSFKYKFTKSFP